MGARGGWRASIGSAPATPLAATFTHNLLAPSVGARMMAGSQFATPYGTPPCRTHAP